MKNSIILNKQYSQLPALLRLPDLTLVHFHLRITLNFTKTFKRNELITILNILCKQMRPNHEEIQFALNSIARRYQVCIDKDEQRFRVET